MMQVAIFGRAQRVPAPYSRRSVMHRSKLDIGGADAGAGGMAISSSSGGMLARVRGIGMRRLHRLTLLPWPIPSEPASAGVWRDMLGERVHRGHGVARRLRRHRGTVGHAVTQTSPSTPSFCRRGP